MLETKLPVSPRIAFTNVVGSVDGIELRLRLEPGGGCVEAIAAQATGFHPMESKQAESVGDDGIRLSVNEHYTGRRWHLRCVAAP